MTGLDFRLVESYIGAPVLRDVGGGRRRVIREFAPDPVADAADQECLAVVLPVTRPNRRGWTVEVTATDYAAWTDYTTSPPGPFTVRRFYTRGAQTWVKGEDTGTLNDLPRLVTEAAALNDPFPVTPHVPRPRAEPRTPAARAYAEARRQRDADRRAAVDEARRQGEAVRYGNARITRLDVNGRPVGELAWSGRTTTSSTTNWPVATVTVDGRAIDTTLSPWHGTDPADF